MATLTASALLAALPELGTLSQGGITALAGLAPYNRDSGAFRGTRAISGGHIAAWAALFMAPFSATPWNTRFKAFYQRRRDVAKHHKVPLVAVMRKLLICLNALLKHHISLAPATPWIITFKTQLLSFSKDQLPENMRS